ncbi:DNA anti-recombination protein (rearrangement mutator) RmuC [Persephonella hydrogeniphila]|uniref:DNA anti-recombination protein (Rearrangement mutator) RmuC n=1 Tax=Persephonella hydrogeniphila TaxID=198703 RepID=A0A285NHV6_9AQUI|nr:DNA recombination protein RmuC [Persephonella hydrogeniphila]SNZ09102.1 DNA anti-recombination protein (rearrangement mutator) RmuC [Persephonella hydrogeniphila]
MDLVILQGLILLFLIFLTVIAVLIYKKISSSEEIIKLQQKINIDNENIKGILDNLKDRFNTIELEFENKIVKNITSDLTKTKEDLINNLLNLREVVHKTAGDLNSKSDNISHETKEKLSELEKEITKTIKEISQSLSENTSRIIIDIKNTIQKINTEFTESTSQLSEKLGKIDQQLQNIEKISSEIQTLQNILKPPKQRGIFGEKLLELLIKDILPENKYAFQFPIGTDKVDAVLKLDGKILPIDAKFPLDNFLKSINDDANLKNLIKNTKNMIDDISSKYIKPSEYKTTNFALMYIPAESVWYEIFVKNPDIYKYAIQKRVFPVSPHTIMTYLQVISEGLKAFEIEKDVEIVINEINSLKNEIEKTVNEYEILERHLSNAIKKVNLTKELLIEINTKIETFGKSKKLEV